MAADGHLNFDTKLDSSGFSSGIKKVGSLAKSGMAVLGTAVAGVATAFGGLSKAALDSVASLEQNIGGVETLFKDSAQTVIDNANNAYKTAGMSANEYMQNVTSFSASLLQSVAGDTAEAAKIADMAMVDMSDNANKMGTDMERITDAYQGFAKQNYTMLDNLKLGYGGTKTEMQRLLDDATKLSGVKYDINNLSDVYSAIHVIQEDLGITGTTAQEAATTIEGSMASAKAAFDNFLNGSGSAEELADTITVAAENIGSNLAEIVPRLIETVPAVIEGLGEAVEENSGQLTQFGSNLISTILTGAMNALPGMVDVAIGAINFMIQQVDANLPQLLAAGGRLIVALVNGALTLIPSLAELGISIISTIVQGIGTSLSGMTDSGGSAVGEMVDGALSQLPDLISAGGELLNSAVSGVLSGLPDALESGVEIAGSVATGILNNLPEVLGAIASVLVQLIATILSHLPEILQTGLELIGSLVAGIIEAIPDVVEGAGQIVSEIWDTIKETDWLQLGADIISGLVNGLKNGISRIAEAAKEVAGGALDAAADFLGIHSPSRVFRDEIGRNIALGLAEGIRQNKDYAKKSAEEISQAVLDAAQKRLDNYKVYNNLNLAEEAAYWDSVRQQTDEGTQARIDADEKYFDAKKDLNEKMADAEEDYTDKVAEAYENLNDKIQDLNKEYSDAVESRTEAIAGAYGLFDEFNMDTDLTSDDLLNNLQGQVDGLEQWMDNLDELSDRGVGDDLIAELQELGPQSAAQVRLLTEMTDDELDEYVNLFRRKNRLARSQALDELRPMQDDIAQQIAELKAETSKELEQYQAEYISAMEQLGVALDMPAEELKLKMSQNAVEMVAALAQSIKDEAGSTENQERFQAIAENVLNAASNLPADLAAVGLQAIDSMAQSILSGTGTLAQAVSAVVSSAIDQAVGSDFSANAIREAISETTAASGETPIPARTYGNDGYGPGYQLDYARMGQQMAAALDGVNVSMDGQKVGNIVSEPVNDNLGNQGRMEERDIV